jgi:7-cyano-7-deazaguanine synthase in queuosine biosynthesis
LLHDNYNVALVGHHKIGSGEKGFQEAIYALFKNEYPKRQIQQHSFYVQPQQNHPKATKESSSRARSIIFFALGLAVANSINGSTPLYVPENGFISLNIPLSLTRLGSLSTRTTHPNVFRLLKTVLDRLGIQNPIINPYQFMTKGEMIVQSPLKELIVKTNSLTMSCAHPDVARWHGRSPGTHCGYCTPCIIRRAALNVVGADQESDYVINLATNAPSPDEESGLDLRAFKLAIEENRTATKGNFLRILSSGPLHIQNEEQLSAYQRVYQQGLREISNIIGR